MWRPAVLADSRDVVCVAPRVDASDVDRSGMVDVCRWSMPDEDDARRRRHRALTSQRRAPKEPQCIFEFAKAHPHVVRRARDVLHLHVANAE